MKIPILSAVYLILSLVAAACVPLTPSSQTISPVPSNSSGLPIATGIFTSSPTSLPTQIFSESMSTATSAPRITIQAQDLDIPWELAFLPDGDLLITERSGTLLVVGDELTSIQVSGVHHEGEGGLLGLALDPNFAENRYLYLYLTSSEESQLVNRVERYTYQNRALTDRQVILEGIRGNTNHNGGRIEFGPDGYLYITTGDAGSSDSAQDLNSLNGKILRITPDGEIPADNPFNSPVYSYGHRNPQGLAWDDQERLWSTEHGPSGAGSGFDELNLIEPGNNYGWPIIQGDEIQEGMTNPVLHSGSESTWAPGEVEFTNGRLFFSGLRGSALYSVRIEGQEVTDFKSFLQGEYGRLRIVRLSADGLLYVGTSNRDGRGQIRPGDDQLLILNPDLFD